MTGAGDNRGTRQNGAVTDGAVEGDKIAQLGYVRSRAAIP